MKIEIKENTTLDLAAAKLIVAIARKGIERGDNCDDETLAMLGVAAVEQKVQETEDLKVYAAKTTWTFGREWTPTFICRGHYERDEAKDGNTVVDFRSGPVDEKCAHCEVRKNILRRASN